MSLLKVRVLTRNFGTGSKVVFGVVLKESLLVSSLAPLVGVDSQPASMDGNVETFSASTRGRVPVLDGSTTIYASSDFGSQERHCDSSLECRLNPVLSRPVKSPVCTLQRAVVYNPPSLLLSGREIEQGTGPVWVSNIIPALALIHRGQKTYFSESSETKGDSVWVAEEEPDIADCRSPLPHRPDSHQSSQFAFSTPFVGSQSHYHRLVAIRHHTLLPVVEGGRWMRITGTYCGPLASSLSLNRPFLDGSVRYKSKKKIKKARQKKREIIAKIKRVRISSKKRKEEMTREESLEFRLEKGSKKIELSKQALTKFPVQEIPAEDKDIEVLTPEQLQYLRKIGYKNRNYVPVGRRGIYGGTIQNIHLHWKKHETVQVDIAGFTQEQIKVMADQLARLSGGIVIDIHRGNIVILYRGRNYQQPKQLIPMKTLDKRKALMKSKLEQSIQALEENQKRVKQELVALREEKARMQRRKPLESSWHEFGHSGRQQDSEQSLECQEEPEQSPKFQETEQSPEPQYPKAYPEWSYLYDSENDEEPIFALEDPGDDHNWKYRFASEDDVPSIRKQSNSPLDIDDKDNEVCEECSSHSDLEDNGVPSVHEESDYSDLEDNAVPLVNDESDHSDSEDDCNYSPVVLNECDSVASLVFEDSNSFSDEEKSDPRAVLEKSIFPSDLDDIQDAEGIYVKDDKAIAK